MRTRWSRRRVQRDIHWTVQRVPGSQQAVLDQPAVARPQAGSLHRGKLEKTPEQTLDLQPGELVQIETRDEIVQTLDANNRAWSFGEEMLEYCGRQARVLRGVERVIDEPSGRMVEFKNPCIVLEDVICSGDHRQCRLPGVRRVLANAVARAHNPTPLAVPTDSAECPPGWWRRRGSVGASRTRRTAPRQAGGRRGLSWCL